MEIIYDLDPMWSRFGKLVLKQVLKRDEFTSTSPSVNDGDLRLAIDLDLEISVRATLVSD